MAFLSALSTPSPLRGAGEVQVPTLKGASRTPVRPAPRGGTKYHAVVIRLGAQENIVHTFHTMRLFFKAYFFFQYRPDTSHKPLSSQKIMLPKG
jgi:hypothetical protein